ncbi:hypothetical protein [Actinomyces trachealis]|uniref:hypothetical protein n=1 Tax=Actinomyces trachealis TaxID=2763540 RepID=UPI0018929355|nr:hypothetical protein [Actinomyces trachealis]
MNGFQARSSLILGTLPAYLQVQKNRLVRSDHVAPLAAAVLIVIGIAVILALGLTVAWWVSCRNIGMYPALDMPSWQSGGTWKAYCRP